MTRLLTGCFIWLPLVLAQDTTLFVSTTGSDAGPGTAAKPFATLAKARDAVRSRRKQGKATVKIRGGAYTLTEPVVLTAEDSGTTYEAYPGETPVLSGGRRITGWKRATGKDAWVAAVSGDFHQLFVNGQRRQRARTPNEGYLRLEGQMSFEPHSQFHYKEGDFQPSWAQPGAEVVSVCNWQMYRIPILSVDAAARNVVLAGQRTSNGGCRGMRYFVENTPEALDAPGEWYLDHKAELLYYIPMPGEDMTRIEAVATVLPRLVEIEGAHDITLRGLTFEYADWSYGPQGWSDIQAASDIDAAVEARGARSCSIENCVLKHLGEYAIAFGKGSKGNRILGNEMADLGGGGVKIGDSNSNAHPGRGTDRTNAGEGLKSAVENVNYPNTDAETTSGNMISDNRIHDIGSVFGGAVGVWIGQSYGNTVSHNEIHDTYYSGVSAGWTWGWGRTAAHDNIIEFNHIYNIGRGQLCDMGCVYTVGSQPGTVIRNNVCHDVNRFDDGYGAWGFYIDAASTHILVENNIAYRAHDGGIHNQYGQENTYRNNIFAFGTRSELMRAGSNNHTAKKQSFLFEHNIVYWKDGPLLWGHWDNNNYKLDHNIYFRTDGQPILFGTVAGPGSGKSPWMLTFEQWQEQQGQDKHSMVADPLFVDPEHGNFSLKPESPALKMGFHPIDISQVGPRKKETRK